MSDITATMLQDKLNSIERNAYDGIDFNQEVAAAYVLADELGERIDQLSAENAKLRDERDRMYKANVEKNGEILRLLEENAKLRELVKGLMGHVMHPPCEGCIAEMNCDCSDLTQCDEWLFFEADARRLGVEVG